MMLLRPNKTLTTLVTTLGLLAGVAAHADEERDAAYTDDDGSGEIADLEGDGEVAERGEVAAQSLLVLDFPDHALDALDFAYNLLPANNLRNDNHILTRTTDASGTTHRAETKCGSFIAALLKLSYPELASPDWITSLTGSPFPDAKQWYEAIGRIRGVYELRSIPTASQMIMGDIIAARFDHDNETGHAMVNMVITPQDAADGTGVAVAGTTQKVMMVVDSSANPHSDDTRTNACGSGCDQKGVGRGYIRIYVSNTTGAIVAWQWSLENGDLFYATETPKFTCPTTPSSWANNHVCESRPLHVMRLLKNGQLL